MEQNPIGLDGLDFIEFSGPNITFLQDFCKRLGFSKIAKHKTTQLELWRQGDINFVLNSEPNSFAQEFQKQHGPAACAMGVRVQDAEKAFATAVKRGAKAFEGSVKSKAGWTMPAVYGIGNSLIYFVDKYKGNTIYDELFDYTSNERHPKGKGLTLIDHLTNNVPVGEMQKWCDFYENIFNFKEKRYFDIKGKSTGLISKVMRSPCGKFSIPINEPTDSKSQIQEYLDEYKGSGIQHIALLANDICDSVKLLLNDKIEFLDGPPATYYEMIPERLPGVTEDIKKIQSLNVLVDGDPEGYLLQIFTKNQVGPIFIEIIQRKNHFGFGEGNFQALFDSIEADQRRRGVI